MSSNEEEKTSKYNSAIAILYRIDLLWKDCHYHSRNGQYLKWNLDLDRVWCEVSADLSEDDVKMFNEINIELSMVGFKLNKEGEMINRHLLYPILMKKELFLRKVQNKIGMGVAYEESLDDYMD